MEDLKKEYNLPFNKISFMKYLKGFGAFSIILTIASFVIIYLKGFNLGLDFTGGTVIESIFTHSVNLTQIRELLEHNGFVNALVQTTGSEKELLIRLASSENMQISDKIVHLLHTIDPKVTIKSIEFVGPKIGSELGQSAIWATLATLAILLIYVGLRFEIRLAFGAVLALFHDVMVTVAVFSLLQIEINLTFVAAILSVVGYSLNDSVVVFDRVRENFRKIRRLDEETIIDISLTQTLSRTLMTSITTLFVVIALLLLGGSSLYSFSMALLIGIAFGTYSSIYIAIGAAFAIGLKREHMLVPVVNKDEEEQIFIDN